MVRRYFLGILSSLLVGAPAAAQWECQILENELFSNPSQSHAYMGYCLDLVGDTLLCGMPGTGTQALGVFGAAVTYRRTPQGWEFGELLVAGDPQDGQDLGKSISGRGDRVLVGGLGIAVLFRESAGSWIREHEFLEPQRYGYGYSVALDEGRIAIGDPSGNNSGIVYVYRPAAGTWVEEAALAPLAGGFIGESVDLEGGLLVTGAPNAPEPAQSAGTASVFELGPGGWTTVARLMPSVSWAYYRFGAAVEIVDGRILVGCPGYIESGGSSAPVQPGSGIVYVFEKVGGVWTETGTILPPAVDFEYSQFGYSLDSEDGRVAIGTGGYPTLQQGAFVYEHGPSGWQLRNAVTYHDHGDVGGSFYGRAVAIEGETLAVGAHWRDGPYSPHAGGVYLYELDHRVTPYCVAVPSSLGVPAELSISGVLGISQNDLTFHASPVPDQPGILFYGTDQALIPFGGGFRCVAAPVFRLAPVAAGGGQLDLPIDLTAPPSVAGQILPGTWYFQAWFRDPAAGSPGSGLSRALAVDLCP